MVQWSQQKPHPVVSAQQLNVVLGHGVYHQVVQTTGTQNLNSVGMWMMHSIPGVRTCWWFSMSLGAKITILCYTFGLNRVHQVPLVYHHFPHWNWSLKVRLIFLDKLMFFPRGLFEAFFFVCVYVCVSSSCVHQTSNLRNTQLASVQVLSPVAPSLQPKCCLQPGCGSMGSIFS